MQNQYPPQMVDQQQYQMPPVQQYPPPMGQQQPMSQQVYQPVLVTDLSQCPEPVYTKCSSCGQCSTTQMEYKVGRGAVTCCVILLFTVGCCLFPLFQKKCKDKIHHCSQCQVQLGVCQYKICNKKGRRNRRG